MYILGVHVGHDSSAALIHNGKIVADVQEERFNRIKHSVDMPLHSIDYCLKSANITAADLDAVAFSLSHPIHEYKMMFPDLEYPEESGSIKKKIKEYLTDRLHGESRALPVYMEPYRTSKKTKVVFVEHHLAHAASAYLTCGRPKSEKMLIATIDGTGEGVSTAMWKGENGRITPLVKYGREGSIGWFYSNVTEALGWWHGDGEGTLMGFAPYGDAQKAIHLFEGYHPVFENGALKTSYDFGPLEHLELGGSRQHHLRDAVLFKTFLDKHKPEDMAAAAQVILENEVKKFIFPWLEKENTRNLACAGGVFLNVKLNQRIWNSGKVDLQHIYPNAGDSGVAVGAALYAHHELNPSAEIIEIDTLYKGPEFSDAEIEKILKDRNLDYIKSDNVCKDVAKDLSENKIIGWVQGRMESGPRALGNRSILMSANKSENKDVVNARVKFRQAFRPFCPSLLAEHQHTYLKNSRKEEYMITSFDVTDDKRNKIPAVVHQDGTLRPQLVYREKNPRYYELLKEFEALTGEGLLLNTSLNIKGEPMICNPREAIRCFYDNGIDTLALGNFILRKNK